MSPTIAQMVPGAGLARTSQLPVTGEASFAQHLEHQLQTEQGGATNLLGSTAPQAKASAPKAQTAEVPATVEAVLQQLMVKLQAVADQPGSKAAAGEWTFQLQDLGLLEKLATQAGMEATGLAALKKQLQGQGGLPLADLFAALEKNFQELATATKVTVPETYLPLLETLLTKVGVAPEVIKQLDSKGVNGVDQLDLVAYLQGLQAVPRQLEGPDGASTCVLSPWELEQFSALLTEAGVPAAKLEALFPEKMSLEQRALAGLHPEQGDAPVTMSLDRLTSLLQQAVEAVGAARHQTDPAGFFNELGTILTQAGFKSSDVGWSPVVQGTMQAAYDALQKLVNQGQGPGENRVASIAQNAALDQAGQEDAVDRTEATRLAALNQPRTEPDPATITLSQDELEQLAARSGQQALPAGEGDRPQPDLTQPGRGQDGPLSPAGLPGEAQALAPGLTPIVMAPLQTTLNSQPQLVPLGQGREAKSIQIRAQNEKIDQEWQLTAGAESGLPALPPSQEASELSPDDSTPFGQQDTLTWAADSLPEKLSPVVGLETRAASPMPTEAASRTLPPRLHLAPELQQLTVEQISQGVLRALKANEHHLTLTLYPKELGEVKVDLQMRGSQLSASFVMENHKVKEAMESNMGEFKDNLERRGFSLGAMSVSVGDQNHSDDSRQRFVAAWEQMQTNQGREHTVTPGASPLEFMRHEQATTRPGGISVFV